MAIFERVRSPVVHAHTLLLPYRLPPGKNQPAVISGRPRRPTCTLRAARQRPSGEQHLLYGSGVPVLWRSLIPQEKYPLEKVQLHYLRKCHCSVKNSLSFDRISEWKGAFSSFFSLWRSFIRRICILLAIEWLETRLKLSVQFFVSLSSCGLLWFRSQLCLLLTQPYSIVSTSVVMNKLHSSLLKLV